MANDPASATREPFMSCLDCGYTLDFLPCNRCPECGRTFDPQIPTTFRRAVRRPSALEITIAYLLPFIIGFVFWVFIGSAKWHRSGNWPPVGARVYGALIQAAGPVAWSPIGPNPFVTTGIVLMLWVAWLLVVMNTRLRRLSTVLHFWFAMLWCFCGCMRLSLSV
jgi:hypothetical protein